VIEPPAIPTGRINLLIATAFVMVIVCLIVIVFAALDDEFSKATITLILGRFLGYTDNIYNYDFGTTRSSANKDATINTLTKTASVVAATAQATQVAADNVTTTESPTQVDEVKIEAKTASIVVDNQTKG